MNKSALIVDDDRTERRLVMGILKNNIDINFIEAENGHDALRILDNDREKNITLVILDLEMPVMGGLAALGIMKKKYSALSVIVLTGSTNMSDAIKAMKMGAADFLSKPIENARLEVSAGNALKMSRMSQEIQELKRRTREGLHFSDLIGYDAGLKDTIKTGRKAAAGDLPVLITGETGTGKEMFARAIHGESRRAAKNFIAINCGAIPEKLVESTLFGHEKGAFTGAINKVAGKFQESGGGTIFLDEISELPLESQVKLLRALQQKEVEPVGAGKPVPVDVRVVSAANCDLAGEVKAGRFREDLFFRLNVLHIELPPLRERKEDILPMTRHFMKQFCAVHQALAREITEEALAKLQNHAWPGNVRELENVINRATALSENTQLGPQDFSFLQAMHISDAPQRDENTIMPLHKDGTFKSLRELEQEIIAMALAHHENNVSQTARVLGIAKSTLYTKLEGLADLKSA